jgi:hypothetical protein
MSSQDKFRLSLRDQINYVRTVLELTEQKLAQQVGSLLLLMFSSSDYLELNHNFLTGGQFDGINIAFCGGGLSSVTTLFGLTADCEGETPEVVCTCKCFSQP